MPPHPLESERRARLANLLRAEIPPAPDPEGRPRPPVRLEVFGVGPDWAQLTWSRLGPGPVTFRAGGREMTVTADGGPGAAVIGELVSDCRVEIEAVGSWGRTTLTTHTLPRPDGALLGRIATVSDSHIGSASTGYLHTIIEKPAPAVPHPERCLRAAVLEAESWGADELLVKGDLVDRSSDANWSAAEAALAGFPGPVSIVAGNHEWSSRGDGRAQVGIAAMGHRAVWGVAHHDRPGLRVVLADTAVAGRDSGHLSATTAAEIVDAVAGADTAVLVAIHHQLTRLPFPTYLPVGVPRTESVALVEAVAGANPRTLITSGHTHRHRRRRHAGVTLSEVGSTKDFPGTWAGYEIYEGGLVQVVRRIAEPSSIRWTDWTRRAAGGVWQLWSPGRLGDRCFTLRW